MGTRGLWGFVVKGEEKLTYNHFDSYPAGLGKDLVASLKAIDLGVLRAKAEALVMVDEQDVPSKKEIAQVREHSGGPVDALDWYSTLREFQGDLRGTLSVGYMTEGAEFALHSLFCEYGYVIDLDSGVFEVYCGFQDSPHEEGRFSALGRAEGEEKYYPIRLVMTIPLSGLPDPDDFIEQADRVCEEARA